MDSYDIVKLQNIAYVNSQMACAQIELVAMEATNAERWGHGQSLAYSEADFLAIIDKYQLGHNSVLTNLHQGQ